MVWLKRIPGSRICAAAAAALRLNRSFASCAPLSTARSFTAKNSKPWLLAFERLPWDKCNCFCTFGPPQTDEMSAYATSRNTFILKRRIHGTFGFCNSANVFLCYSSPPYSLQLSAEERRGHTYNSLEVLPVFPKQTTGQICLEPSFSLWRGGGRTRPYFMQFGSFGICGAPLEADQSEGGGDRADQWDRVKSDRWDQRWAMIPLLGGAILPYLETR